jgi:hypothetical protein
MNSRLIKQVLSLVLGLGSLTVIWINYGWILAVCLFLMLMGNNIENSIGINDKLRDLLTKLKGGK